MKRICIIGTSGSGKSTLGKTLAHRLQLPFIDSDSFFWQANWQSASEATLQEQVFAATAGDAWVFDGNYLWLRHTVWQRADTVVWLDFPLAVVLSRVCSRNAGQVIRRERLWNGNRRSWRRAYSGVRHAWSTYQHKKITYPGLLLEFPHLHIIHIQTPRQAKQWLRDLTPAQPEYHHD